MGLFINCALTLPLYVVCFLFYNSIDKIAMEEVVIEISKQKIDKVSQPRAVCCIYYIIGIFSLFQRALWKKFEY